MKSAGKARSNGLYRHIRTSKEIIRNLLNDYYKKLGKMQIIVKYVNSKKNTKFASLEFLILVEC